MNRKRKPQKLLDVGEALIQIHRDSICTATRELWLHSTHSGDEEPGIEYRMATTFLKNLNILEKDSVAPILIHMHCVGGEWNDGMAIFDAIHLSPCDTTIIAYAQASSMSGIILQAAKTRLVMPSCEFMAHVGSLDTHENILAVKAMADRNMACHDKMLDIFARRCMLAPQYQCHDIDAMKYKIDQWIKDKGEINIVGQEIVDHGFADGVIGDQEYPSVYHVWQKIGG